MKRYQCFGPEDLRLMGEVFLRANREMPGRGDDEKRKTLLARAILITYRRNSTEAALAAAARHLVQLKILAEDIPRHSQNFNPSS